MNDSSTFKARPTLELVLTAYNKEQMPKLPEAQIALAGRSNVGKSSLINALAGRKKLAKVSSYPGKTRSINFYKALPYGFYLVDLPGYGYARVSHREKLHWASILNHYLDAGNSLRALTLVLDCRLPPQKLDMDLAAFAAQKGLPILPVLAKADKCNQRDREIRKKEWHDILDAWPILTSAPKNMGLEKVWQALIFLATGSAACEFPSMK